MNLTSNIPLIFIADDDLGARLTLQALLEDQGYELSFFEDGKFLLDALPSSQPDLILLDVMMPELSGYDVCERIRAMPEYEGIPIIMITALDDTDAKLKAINVGADDFLTKPYNRAELRARVRLITRLNRYRKTMLAEKRLHWTLENSQDGYLIINENDKILFSNQAARSFLQMDEGKTLFFLEQAHLQFECNPVVYWKDWPKDLAGAACKRFLVRPETAIARAIWLEVDVFPGIIPGESQFLIRLRDISEQVSSQRELFGFHKALNHKLRTPLGVVIGYMELLATDLAASDERLQEMCNLALNGARTLSSRIQDILQFVNMPLVCDPQNRMQLSHLRDMVTEINQSLNIEHLDYHIEPFLNGRSLVLSPSSLETIFWELLENAIKFHPTRQPQIWVGVHQASRREVQIEVINSGTDVAPQALEHIWEPYYQAEKSYSGQVPGMGLGLSLVAGIIWQAGGKVDFRRIQDGTGVVVTLSIPIA